MLRYKSYSFNHPLALLLLLPLLLLLYMLSYGLSLEFSVMPLLALAFTVLLIILILFYGFLRWVKIGGAAAHWSTPFQRLELSRDSIRHFGIVKYRAFRFIYFSTDEKAPFQDVNAHVSTNSSTFVMQYRRGAWQHVEAWLKSSPSAATRHDAHIR